MQALVYLFIALAALGVGTAAYFGLTFTPIEAIMLAALVFGLCVIGVERTLRRRAEDQLAKAIDELRRLLATNAQAGQVLSQRINALVDLDAGQRIERVESDISVLGTVVRQLAEAVSDLEERSHPPAPSAAPPQPVPAAPRLAEPDELAVPLNAVRLAIEDERLEFHLQPVVTLPQRRVVGYDLVPRLFLDDGTIAELRDFMPERGAEDVARTIGTKALAEAMNLVHRARAGDAALTLYVPAFSPMLADPVAFGAAARLLDANRGVAANLGLALPAAQWGTLEDRTRAGILALVKKGIGLTLSNATTLRLDWPALAAAGVRSVRVDAARFTAEPQRFTDFHAADVVPYAARFGIDLLAANVTSEQEIIALIEDGFRFAQGGHIALPGPARPDLFYDRSTAAFARNARA